MYCIMIEIFVVYMPRNRLRYKYMLSAKALTALVHLCNVYSYNLPPLAIRDVGNSRNQARSIGRTMFNGGHLLRFVGWRHTTCLTCIVGCESTFNFIS